jgi:hypothetical protein
MGVGMVPLGERKGCLGVRVEICLRVSTSDKNQSLKTPNELYLGREVLLRWEVGPILRGTSAGRHEKK